MAGLAAMQTAATARFAQTSEPAASSALSEPASGSPAAPRSPKAPRLDAAPRPALSAAPQDTSAPPSNAPGLDSRASIPSQPAEQAARANYTFEVTFDALAHALETEGTIQFENHTAHALNEVYVHLYLNAFAHRRTVWARDPFTTGRDGGFPQRPGRIHVERFVDTRNDVDLWPQRTLGDPGETGDETNLRVPLTLPIEPGQTVTFEVRFRSELPSLVQRTGFAGDYHFFGQWFLKLAKLRADGSWAHFPFHPHAEFYADFGDYEVTLEVPTRFVVGASGQRVEEQETSGRKRLRYVAENVHDFAWTAWPDYQQRLEHIDGSDVRVLYPPAHEHNVARTLEVLRFALPYFRERFGSYPYPTLTVVHPPRQGAAAGGMEYPTLITTGGAWFSPWLSRRVELVTLHELAHQWFFGLVASDEPNVPFLDEGLTTYAEGLASRALFGDADASNVLGLQLSTRAFHRAGAANDGLDFVVAQPARDFPSFRQLGNLAYARATTLFDTLDAVYAGGFQAALAHYARKHRFSHAAPEDLLRTIEATLGSEVRETTRRALFERGWVDYQIEALSHRRAPNPAGGPARSAESLSRVIVVRRGDLVFPVQILLVDDAGERFVRDWDGRETHVMLEHRGRPIVSATVDPERRVLLDQDLLNNAATTQAHGSLRVSSWLTWGAQLLLHWIES